MEVLVVGGSGAPAGVLPLSTASPCGCSQPSAVSAAPALSLQRAGAAGLKEVVKVGSSLPLVVNSWKPRPLTGSSPLQTG